MDDNNHNPDSPLGTLRRAVDLLGGQTAVAKICQEVSPEVRQGHVYNWLNRDKKLPEKFAPLIAIKASEVAQVRGNPGITMEKLCPNFPWHMVRRVA